MKQIHPFGPKFHLGEMVERLGGSRHARKAAVPHRHRQRQDDRGQGRVRRRRRRVVPAEEAADSGPRRLREQKRLLFRSQDGPFPRPTRGYRRRRRFGARLGAEPASRRRPHHPRPPPRRVPRRAPFGQRHARAGQFRRDGVRAWPGDGGQGRGRPALSADHPPRERRASTITPATTCCRSSA